jgi:hypothetical protein
MMKLKIEVNFIFFISISDSQSISVKTPDLKHFFGFFSWIVVLIY